MLVEVGAQGTRSKTIRPICSLCFCHDFNLVESSN